MIYRNVVARLRIGQTRIETKLGIVIIGKKNVSETVIEDMIVLETVVMISKIEINTGLCAKNFIFFKTFLLSFLFLLTEVGEMIVQISMNALINLIVQKNMIAKHRIHPPIVVEIVTAIVIVIAQEIDLETTTAIVTVIVVGETVIVTTQKIAIVTEIVHKRTNNQHHYCRMIIAIIIINNNNLNDHTPESEKTNTVQNLVIVQICHQH